MASLQVKTLLSPSEAPRRYHTSRGPPFTQLAAGNPCKRCGGTGRTRCGNCYGAGTSTGAYTYSNEDWSIVKGMLDVACVCRTLERG